jgi:NitT/TauT family transport system ATP-binding protein
MKIDVQDLGYNPSSRGAAPVIKDLSLEIASTEFLAIVGPSGCGKTSLLKLIAGLEKPHAGQISFSDADGVRQPRCLMAFQEHGLFPWLNVIDNACIGLEALGYSRSDRYERAMKVLKRIGLDSVAFDSPSTLSGGMRQRISLVRLMISEGEILLLDEPLSAVDAQTRIFLQQELLDLWAGAPRTTIYVTHDIEEALTLADRVIVMAKQGGEILADLLVPTPRPRIATARPTAEIETLRWKIWDLLSTDKAEVPDRSNANEGAGE